MFNSLDDSGKLTSGNKFLQGADIPALITEAMNKKPTLTKTVSVVNGETINTYLANVEMGRQVGWNSGQTTVRNNLLIILDESGNIVSVYPK